MLPVLFFLFMTALTIQVLLRFYTYFRNAYYSQVVFIPENQGCFNTQGSNPGLLYCMQILYQLSHREAKEYWSGWPIPSPADLPYPGTKPESPVLQVGSLSTELSGKPSTSTTLTKKQQQQCDHHIYKMKNENPIIVLS